MSIADLLNNGTDQADWTHPKGISIFLGNKPSYQPYQAVPNKLWNHVNAVECSVVPFGPTPIDQHVFALLELFILDVMLLFPISVVDPDIMHLETNSTSVWKWGDPFLEACSTLFCTKMDKLSIVISQEYWFQVKLVLYLFLLHVYILDGRFVHYFVSY